MRKSKVVVPSERRHDARVHVHGSVVVHAHGCTRGRVLDVSSGGVCFQVADGDVVGPRGTHVTLQLRLDGAHQRWVRLDGRIGRVGDDGTVSVCFAHVPTDFEDVIQDQLLFLLECDSQRHVLVVDPDPVRRRQTVTNLREDGWHVTKTTSPLEAIDHLGEASTHPLVVLVAPTLPASAGAELRRYITREHTGVRVSSRGVRLGSRPLSSREEAGASR